MEQKRSEKKWLGSLKRKKKNGWSFTATIRIKGYPSACRTFDTKGEAAAWAAKTEDAIKANKYNDPRLAMHIYFWSGSREIFELNFFKKGD